MSTTFQPATRSTSLVAIEADLRARAEGPAFTDAVSSGHQFAYLFGMATVVIAEANREIEQLQRRIAEMEADHA